MPYLVPAGYVGAVLYAPRLQKFCCPAGFFAARAVADYLALIGPRQHLHHWAGCAERSSESYRRARYTRILQNKDSFPPNVDQVVSEYSALLFVIFFRKGGTRLQAIWRLRPSISRRLLHSLDRAHPHQSQLRQTNHLLRMLAGPARRRKRRRRRSEKTAGQ